MSSCVLARWLGGTGRSDGYGVQQAAACDDGDGCTADIVGLQRSKRDGAELFEPDRATVEESVVLAGTLWCIDSTRDLPRGSR